MLLGQEMMLLVVVSVSVLLSFYAKCRFTLII